MCEAVAHDALQCFVLRVDPAHRQDRGAVFRRREGEAPRSLPAAVSSEQPDDPMDALEEESGFEASELSTLQVRTPLPQSPPLAWPGIGLGFRVYTLTLNPKVTSHCMDQAGRSGFLPVSCKPRRQN